MTKLILLVEDNPTDEKLMRRAFAKCDIPHQIAVVRDGAETLDWLFGTRAYAVRDTAVQPALMLLDLKMPKIDGLEVLRKMRADERTKRVPVVVLTASREEEDIVHAYDLGANAYVRKPVDFTEFVGAAKTMLMFWVLLNEAAPVRRSGS